MRIDVARAAAAAAAVGEIKRAATFGDVEIAWSWWITRNGATMASVIFV